MEKKIEITEINGEVNIKTEGFTSFEIVGACRHLELMMLNKGLNPKSKKKALNKKD